MTLTVRYLAWLLAWSGVLYGVLCVGILPGDFGHALCGPWG
jgi:hypothetical protein